MSTQRTPFEFQNIQPPTLVPTPAEQAEMTSAQAAAHTEVEEALMEEPPVAKKRRGPKPGYKRSVNPQLAAPAKRGAKPQEPVSYTPKKAQPFVLTFTAAAEALRGLEDDDVKFLVGVVEAMQAFSAEQRKRIVDALKKVVA